jgi:hypothetical protein
MINRVVGFFKLHMELLVAAVPALEELIEDLTITNKQMQKLYASISITKTRYSTTKKKSAKARLVMDIDIVMSGVCAYAIMKKDKELLKKVEFSNRELTRPKPEIIAERCKNILDTAKAAGSLQQFGVKPQDIQLAEKSYNSFVELMRAPQQRKKEVTDENKQLVILIDECMYELKHQIDKLVKIALKGKPELKSYMWAREVLRSSPGRRSEKEVKYRASRTKKKKIK